MTLKEASKDFSRIYTVRDSTSTAKYNKYFDLSWSPTDSPETERTFGWKYN